MAMINPLGFGSYSNSASGLGKFQHHDDMNNMARTIHDIAKAHHDQVLARQAQEISMINGEIFPFTHHPAGLGFLRPSPPALQAPVNMTVYYGGGQFDDPFFEVWRGIHSHHPYHMQMGIQNPIPFDEEHDDYGLGLGLRTRNFLGAMEAARNINHANQALQLGSPEQMTVTDEIVEEEPESEEEAVSVVEGIDLDLKL